MNNVGFPIKLHEYSTEPILEATTYSFTVYPKFMHTKTCGANRKVVSLGLAENSTSHFLEIVPQTWLSLPKKTPAMQGECLKCLQSCSLIMGEPIGTTNIMNGRSSHLGVHYWRTLGTLKTWHFDVKDILDRCDFAPIVRGVDMTRYAEAA
jgi:hypothetical protein